MQIPPGAEIKNRIHFGTALGVVLAVFSVLKPGYSPTLLGCATGVLILTILAPAALSLPLRLVKAVGDCVFRVLTLALLTLLFYLLISPLAASRRLAGGAGKWDRPLEEGTGFWKMRKGGPSDPADFEKQF